MIIPVTLGHAGELTADILGGLTGILLGLLLLWFATRRAR